jgi:hypothetical protein
MNKCLRFVILSVLVSCSPIAICDSKDYQQDAVTEISAGHAIVNAFISDPTIGERLREDPKTSPSPWGVPKYPRISHLRARTRHR